MKKTITFLLVIFCSVGAIAQSWLWAKSGTGAGYDYSKSTCIDVNGNVYVTGYFASTNITFGSATLTNTNAGNIDILIVKYDNLGNVLWARKAGGIGDDYSNSIATDASGNIYIAGNFNSSSIAFGSTILNDTNTSPKYFIAKYDNLGNVLWAKTTAVTSVASSFAYSVAVDPSGNPYVAGKFYGSLVLGSITLNSFLNSSANIFTVKYDSSGNVLWAKSEGGNNEQSANSITTDISGNVYLTGYFTSANITLGTTVLTNTAVNNKDIFIVKYSSLGNVIWAKSAGWTDDDDGYSIITDPSGNVFITGMFESSSIVFGSDTLLNNNPGQNSIFVSKYSNTGSVLWAKTSIGGNTSAIAGRCIVSDAIGNVYITGDFAGLSNITFGSFILSPIASYDILVVKYDNAGNVTWAINAGGGNGEYSYGISVDVSNNLYITGAFISSSISFSGTSLINAGPSSDIFLAKLNSLITDNTETEMENSNTLFPNPSSGIFVYEQNILIKSEIEIHNIFGELIYKASTEKQQTTIDLSNVSKGIYFVQVKDSKKNVTNNKIIIQ